VQAWVNEILTLPENTTDTARQSRSTMNGIISQLHKGGIIEVEFSTYPGTSTAIKLIANVMYDKQMTITHENNKATFTIS